MLKPYKRKKGFLASVDVGCVQHKPVVSYSHDYRLIYSAISFFLFFYTCNLAILIRVFSAYLTLATPQYFYKKTMLSLGKHLLQIMQ